jgi:hypothetical protein
VREPLTGRVTSYGSQVVGSGPVGERATPTPGQDPLSLAELAPLLSCRRPTHPSATPWTGRRALGMIPPDDVAIVICRGDLDESVPEFGAPDVLFGLIAADVALEHHVAVVGRADDLPAVLRELVE